MATNEIYQPELFEHGIWQENSDIRAHVSPANQTIYVFITRNVIKTIESIRPEVKLAGQPGVKGVTAQGYVVKIEDIEDIRRVQFNWRWWKHFDEKWPTEKKGKFAVVCVRDCMRAGHFPLWFDAADDERLNIQIAGTDMLVFCRKKIQVKCDSPVARTGNLFIQTAERNPLKKF